MLKNNQVYQIDIGRDVLNQIEQYTDRICDQLFINDTYFGNILMSLTEMVNLVLSGDQNSPIKIHYNTDYQKLKLTFQPIDKEIVKLFNLKIELENILDSDRNRSVFVLNKLTDVIKIEDDYSVSLIFDIGALHNEVYEDRKMKLNTYLRSGQTERVKDRNDHL